MTLRSHGRIVLLVGVLWVGLAAPLSAQQTVVVPDVIVEVENVIDSVLVNVTLKQEPRDSAQIAREEASERAMDAISEYLATCGCVDSGTSNVSVVTNVGLTLAAFFIGWQLKRIADKPNGDDIHNEGDTNVDVNIPPHDHKKRDDHGEGDSHK